MRYVFVAEIVATVAITIAFYKSRKASKKLKSSNEDLESLANSVPGGVIKYNYYTGEFEFVSDGFLDLVGYSINDVIGKFNNNFYNIVEEIDREKLKNNDYIEKEYKIISYNGKTIWILNRGRLIVTKERSIIYSIVIDITERKLLQEKLLLINERDRILLNKTKNIVFEWKMESDTLEISDEWEEKFGYTLNVDNFIKKVVNDKIIYNDDVDRFLDLFQGVINGERLREDVVRIRKKPKNYIWCKVRLVTTYDDDLKAIGAVGVLIDIDRDRRKSEEFRKQAQKDMLTGIYNKTTAEYLIKDYIEDKKKKQKHALFIIDIDDFKGINDNFGHLFGDKVLSKVSYELKRKFRKSDIIGRMGGDEFIILLKDIRNNYIVEKKAEVLKNIFKDSFAEDENRLKVSGSIGIAIYEGDGKSFKELYKNADNALYYAKKHGKNCYHIYNDESDKIRNINDIKKNVI